MSEQFFKNLLTSAEVSSALLLVVILLIYIAFFKESLPRSRKARRATIGR